MRRFLSIVFAVTPLVVVSLSGCDAPPAADDSTDPLPQMFKGVDPTSLPSRPGSGTGMGGGRGSGRGVGPNRGAAPAPEVGPGRHGQGNQDGTGGGNMDGTGGGNQKAKAATKKENSESDKP